MIPPTPEHMPSPHVGSERTSYNDSNDPPLLPLDSPLNIPPRAHHFQAFKPIPRIILLKTLSNLQKHYFSIIYPSSLLHVLRRRKGKTHVTKRGIATARHSSIRTSRGHTRLLANSKRIILKTYVKLSRPFQGLEFGSFSEEPRQQKE